MTTITLQQGILVIVVVVVVCGETKSVLELDSESVDLCCCSVATRVLTSPKA